MLYILGCSLVMESHGVWQGVIKCVRVWETMLGVVECGTEC